MDLAASIVTATATVVLAAIAAWQIRAGREQTEATAAIARETREAAERQWQPRVFARYHGPPAIGDGTTAAPDEMAVPYYLVNEGTGPAFNVHVGIDVAGRVHWREGIWWSMQSREFIPALDPIAKQPVPLKVIYTGVPESAWKPDAYAYVTHFELLGERFEVRSYPDQTRPSGFRRLPVDHGVGSIIGEAP
jgi:hypothetical protein